VLVGDFLFSRAFQLMVADGSLRILEILCGASAKIAEGEVLQLMTSNDTATTEQAYLEVIKGKTAVLFAAACEVGAVVAEKSKREQEALASFGLNLGIAFQLVDDVLDYAAQPDLRPSATISAMANLLPVILAFRRGDAEERSAPHLKIGAEGRRSRPCPGPDAASRRPARLRGAGRPLWRDRPGCPRHLPRWCGETGIAGSSRFRH
jgi:geranylgeranyl pyrophosphate synthase